jgi:hypothetical protein
MSTDANDDSWSHIGRTATKPIRHTALTLIDSSLAEHGAYPDNNVSAL